MTATATAPAELASITEPLAKMLAHDADRIASLTLTTGEHLILNDDRRTLEVGPDWLLVRTGYGESERLVYVAIAAIATVTLR